MYDILCNSSNICCISWSWTKIDLAALLSRLLSQLGNRKHEIAVIILLDSFLSIVILKGERESICLLLLLLIGVSFTLSPTAANFVPSSAVAASAAGQLEQYVTEHQHQW